MLVCGTASPIGRRKRLSDALRAIGRLRLLDGASAYRTPFGLSGIGRLFEAIGRGGAAIG